MSRPGGTPATAIPTPADRHPDAGRPERPRPWSRPTTPRRIENAETDGSLIDNRGLRP